MNYLYEIKKKILGDKVLGLLLYTKYRYFYHYIDLDDYNNFFNTILTDYKLNKFNNIFNIKNVNKKNLIIPIGIGGFGQIYKLDKQYCIKINITNKDDYHEYLIPNKIVEYSKDLRNMIVNPLVLIKKNNLIGLMQIINIHIIFIYLLYCFLLKHAFSLNKLKDMLKNYNISIEYKELYQSKYKNNIYNYVNILLDKYLPTFTKINISNHLLNIIRTVKDKNVIINEGFIIIMPLAQCVSVKLYLNPYTKNISKKGIKAYRIMPKIYRLLFLQVSLFILNIKEYINFSHNDLKQDNILVFPEYKPYTISYNNIEYYFKELFRFKIADFDFSVIHDVIPNKKILKSKLLHNVDWFVDIHFFVHKFFLFLQDVEIDNDVVFFEALHKIFIYPYCNIPYNRMRENLTVKKDNTKIICSEGIYNKKITVNIDILKDFIQTDFFDNWIKKS